MKAQSLRRTLWLVDSLLVLALAGTGAWWFLKVRPASADPGRSRPKWVEASWKSYESQVKVIAPAPIYPVSQKALEKVTRPDLKALGVGAFVGLMPPAPRPPDATPTAPELPKGLEAIGRPRSVIYVPPGDPAVSTVVQWVFPSKSERAFNVGDFVKERKEEKDLFKITAVTRPDREKRIYEITYDVYDPEKNVVAQANQKSVFDLSAPPLKVDAIRSENEPPPTPGTDRPPGSPPGPSGSLPTSVATGALRPGSITKRETSTNNYDVELERDAYDMIFRGNADTLLADLKTDVATDEAGNPKGLRLSGSAPTSLAGQFGITPGDILISINGQKVHSRSEAINVVKAIPQNTTSVKVVVERNARQIVYDIDPRDPEIRKVAPRVKFRPGG